MVVEEVIGRDGQCGSIVPIGDYKAVAREVLRILSDRERRLAMKMQSIDRAISFFSADKMVENYVNLYQELCGH